MKRLFTPSRTVVVLTMLIMTMITANLNFSKDSWKSIIEADAKGYYAYLPAAFIYNDLNFGFFDKIEKEKYYDKNMYYDYRSGSNGKVINKYYAGTAVSQLPFFLAAHSLTLAKGGDADGYSSIYRSSVAWAALFYLFIGLVYLNKTLKIYAISEGQRAFTLVAIVFGTNLFYYTVSEPGLSHIFSFGFISMFIYFTKKYFLDHQPKYLIILGLILGMILLIRPVNGLIILALPFLVGSFENLKNGILSILKQPVPLILSGLICFSICFIQLLIYKISTGSFFVYAYGEEGFNFLSPHFTDILFSYKKGLFLYTPLYLLSFTGLIFLFKRNRYEFYSWLGFFILLTYVFSSWWMWYYGGSFSSRVYVEFLPMFGIMLAVALSNLRTTLQKIVLNTSIVLLIVICQIQTFQYRYYDIHWSDMTQEKYWKVFLRVDRLINKETQAPQ